MSDYGLPGGGDPMPSRGSLADVEVRRPVEDIERLREENDTDRELRDALGLVARLEVENTVLRKRNMELRAESDDLRLQVAILQAAVVEDDRLIAQARRLACHFETSAATDIP